MEQRGLGKRHQKGRKKTVNIFQEGLRIGSEESSGHRLVGSQIGHSRNAINTHPLAFRGQRQ